MADKAKELAPAEKAGGGKKKLLVIVLLALVVLAGGGGAAAYFLGMFGASTPAAAATPADTPDGHAEVSGSGEPAEGHPPEGEHGTAPAPVGPKIIFVDLPDVLVNLNSDSKRMRFLKLRLAVEVSSQPVADRVVQLTPRIMDSFQLYLRGLTVDDLGGPAALHRLKQEMLARINLALDPTRIDDVLFKEMLVQ
jgi:flagellar FliL protein